MVNMSQTHFMTSEPLQSDIALQQAIAFGVDITLLIETLRLTPTERLRRGEQMLRATVAFMVETQQARQRLKEQT
jgi:hypothetical protein